MTFAASCPSYKLTTQGRLVVRVEGLLGLLPLADLAARYGIARQSVRHLLREFDLDEADALKRLTANLPALYALWLRDAEASGVEVSWNEAIKAATSEAMQEPVRIMETALGRLSALESVAASHGPPMTASGQGASPDVQTA